MMELRIEILHGRDPDSSCEFDVFANGERVDHITVESIDPGAGYDVADWDEHTDWVEHQEDYSEPFRQAVAAEREEARSSHYITGDKANRGHPTHDCAYCGRGIRQDRDGRWVNPDATGDDEIWRETCEDHDTFTAEHVPGYLLHYTSADGPGPDATWSVYREVYVSRDADVPVDGSQEHVSTHANEDEANTEARRLQTS